MVTTSQLVSDLNSHLFCVASFCFLFSLIAISTLFWGFSNDTYTVEGLNFNYENQITFRMGLYRYYLSSHITYTLTLSGATTTYSYSTDGDTSCDDQLLDDLDDKYCQDLQSAQSMTTIAFISFLISTILLSLHIVLNSCCKPKNSEASKTHSWITIALGPIANVFLLFFAGICSFAAIGSWSEFIDAANDPGSFNWYIVDNNDDLYQVDDGQFEFDVKVGFSWSLQLVCGIVAIIGCVYGCFKACTGPVEEGPSHYVAYSDAPVVVVATRA